MITVDSRFAVALGRWMYGVRPGLSHAELTVMVARFMENAPVEEKNREQFCTEVARGYAEKEQDAVSPTGSSL